MKKIRIILWVLIEQNIFIETVVIATEKTDQWNKQKVQTQKYRYKYIDIDINIFADMYVFMWKDVRYTVSAVSIIYYLISDF